MHIFLYLILATSVVLANPAQKPVAAPIPQPAGGLLSKLPSLLSGLSELLSPEILDDLQVIVKGGAVLLGGETPSNLKKLVSAENVNKLQHIIDNGDALLTPRFVNSTTTLVEDATPLVAGISGLLRGLFG
ncbi:hypothetical protein BDV33DRAFT_232053 [Aspergillus novoparasiticus]|uniref:Hydrophobic surface binding protein A-domain-containing protein n=1 Tax=Aspergillus novoparasiticus TaxID=986946 RepID=A0A5N6E798_9EURO|nr:hypothetical protein BDV33DRAFT_232053 [Aspergillus novoparasiticus]